MENYNFEEYDKDDEYYKVAKDLASNWQKVSIDFLQKKLGIGYPKAKRIMERLEKDCVVGKHKGFRSREVIIPY